MAQALIVSVGSTPAPVVVALREVAPSFVCFLASHQSIEKIPEIKREAGVDCTDEKVIVDDHEDLLGCYRKAVECLRRTQARGFSTRESVVDYTGGTKAMTAALAMAAASHGVAFSYVGGERDSGGLGVVRSGSERRRVEMDPLRLFAVEEKRRIALYFNSHQYSAAATALRELLPTQPQPEHAILEALLEITEAYTAWDRFDHRTAFQLLPPARTRLDERARIASVTEYASLLSTVKKNVAVLGQLRGKTKEFEQAHPDLAADLVANAERRIKEGKYDDAVARLYRAIELLGQCSLQERLGVEAGAVPIAMLPAALREEFARRYADDRGLAKLGLMAVYRVLGELGEGAGIRFANLFTEFQKIMEARNQSILAHGTRPVKESTARRLRDLVASFLPSEARLSEFPQLPW
jgi:CRISPR-associated protein (TIGR02710 family)